MKIKEKTKKKASPSHRQKCVVKNMRKSRKVHNMNIEHVPCTRTRSKKIIVNSLSCGFASKTHLLHQDQSSCQHTARPSIVIYVLSFNIYENKKGLLFLSMCACGYFFSCGKSGVRSMSLMYFTCFCLNSVYCTV